MQRPRKERPRTEIRRQCRSLTGKNPNPFPTPHGNSLIVAYAVSGGPADPRWEDLPPKIGNMRFKLCNMAR